jgi:hypothetical protein
MAGLAGGEEVFDGVFVSAVLHWGAVVNLVCEAETAGVLEFAERVEEEFVSADHAPVFAGVEAVAVAGVLAAGAAAFAFQLAVVLVASAFAADVADEVGTAGHEAIPNRHQA